MSDIIKRPTINALYRMKCDVLVKLSTIRNTDTAIRDILDEFGGYSPLRLDWSLGTTADNSEEKYVDQICWSYLVKLFHLRKYMLCTEYDKLSKEIAEFRAPDFTPENAVAWIDGLKSLIHENVRTMLKSVYDKLISSHYYTGSSSYRGEKKKRNNNGLDSWFILYTYDYQIMYQWAHGMTITDDLEKACYILDGKAVPDRTIKEVMRADKLLEGKNDYFEIRVCKNGNTHYRIHEETRRKLNLIGPDGNIIGEQIRIKIFEK